MKITKQLAERFAQEWITAWNKKDLDAIMNHYANEVVFSSPFILKSQPKNEGTLRGKTELRTYFEMALKKNPDLHFDLLHTMVGIKSITLIYLRKNTMLASEAMVLNHQGKVIEGLSHYPVETLYSLL